MEIANCDRARAWDEKLIRWTQHDSRITTIDHQPSILFLFFFFFLPSPSRYWDVDSRSRLALGFERAPEMMSLSLLRVDFETLAGSSTPDGLRKTAGDVGATRVGASIAWRLSLSNVLIISWAVILEEPFEPFLDGGPLEGVVPDIDVGLNENRAPLEEFSPELPASFDDSGVKGSGTDFLLATC